MTRAQKSRKRFFLSALMLLAYLPPEASAQGLGRLFFTAQERAKLDSSRSNAVLGPQEALMANEAAAKINGFVKRSDGPATVWLDGTPRDGAHLGLTPQAVETPQKIIVRRQKTVNGPPDSAPR